MEVIRGGHGEKYGLEKVVHGFKYIVDWSKVNFPKWNPRQFKLCRNLDGLAKWEFAKRAGLATKRYSDIEAGNILPTDEEFKKIFESQTHVIEGFFQQWPETEPDFSFHPARMKSIDYYQYKVFRDINRPREMVGV